MILPRENEHDLDELPPETKKALEFVPVDTVEEVFAAAFDSRPAIRPAPVSVGGERAARSAGSA